MTVGRLRIPIRLRLWNLLARRWLGAGLSMGPDVLLTVPGRSSGLLRTTPVAVIRGRGPALADRHVWRCRLDAQLARGRPGRDPGGGEAPAGPGGRAQPRGSHRVLPRGAPTLRRSAPVGVLGAELASGLEPQRKRARHDPAAAALRCPVFELHDLGGGGRSRLV
jgi:hypothetical protein